MRKLFFISTSIIAVALIACLYQCIRHHTIKALVAQYDNNSLDEVSAYYENQVLQDPHNAVALYNLGDALYKKGDYQQAKKYFMMAHAESNESKLKAQALFNAGNASAFNNELKEALSCFEILISENPQHESAKHNAEIIKKMMEQQKQEQENKEDSHKNNKDDQHKQEQSGSQDNSSQQDKNKDSSNQSTSDESKEESQSQDQQEHSKDSDKNSQNERSHNDKSDKHDTDSRNDKSQGSEQKSQDKQDNFGKNDRQNSPEKDREQHSQSPDNKQQKNDTKTSQSSAQGSASADQQAPTDTTQSRRDSATDMLFKQLDALDQQLQKELIRCVTKEKEGVRSTHEQKNW